MCSCIEHTRIKLNFINTEAEWPASQVQQCMGSLLSACYRDLPLRMAQFKTHHVSCCGSEGWPKQIGICLSAHSQKIIAQKYFAADCDAICSGFTQSCNCSENVGFRHLGYGQVTHDPWCKVQLKMATLVINCKLDFALEKSFSIELQLQENTAVRNVPQLLLLK